MDYKKSIVKTIWLTLLSMVLLTIVAGVVFVFVFTKQCADFAYSLGCNNIASVLYYKAYEDSDDIAVCYKALNIKISLKDYEKVVTYYESFVADDEYAAFMKFNIENRESLDISILEKSAILNDRNYLVNSYVKALRGISKEDKAKEIVLSEFALKDNLTFKEQGVYGLGQYVDLQDWEFFNTAHQGYNDLLIVEMQEYFEHLIELFDDNKMVNTYSDKAYLVALGNRILDVGQDINAVYTALNVEENQITDNVSNMLIVNNVIKGII